MERISEKSLRARVGYIAKSLERLGKLPENHTVHLSRMQPGDGVRWQIEIVDRDGSGITACYPRGGHWRTQDFDRYLDGMLDAFDMIEHRLGPTP